jgi:hypothetical protein
LAFVVAAVVADDTRWLRFNPDGYKVGGKVRRTPKRVKLDQLVDTIRAVQLRANFSIRYLYYGVDERGVLELCSDPRCSEDFQQYLLAPVF